MDEKTLNRLTESLGDGLSFVEKMINNFDAGAISKLYPYLSEEEKKKILDKKHEIKKVSEDLSKVLSKGGIYDLDNEEIVELKQRIDKIKE